MEKLSMCRICLIKDVRLHCLVNTHLQEIYEFLSGNLLEAKDTRPLHACYMCCARLGNCLRLRTACLHSEELFSHLLENNSCEVTPSQGMNTLQTTPVMNISVGPVAHRELEMKASQMIDEQRNEKHIGDLQDNIIDQGICTQFIKREDIKSENVYSEDEELDYSIQSIKVESNSASDNSLEYGTPESRVSKFNPSISSVDWQDIVGDKTVKIDSFRKAANVTEHLKPIDPEYTSQCYNYRENVEMSKPNTCEKYQQIIHTSSETHCSLNRDSFKHMRTDTGDTIYKCGICEKSYSKKNSLNVHIRRTHNGEKQFDTDGIGFIQKSHLSQHIRTHTAEKPYKCDTCGKGFMQKTNLLRHNRTHTGDTIYKCGICEKSYSKKNSLNVHIRRTHNGEKQNQFDTCGIGFIQSVIHVE